MSSLPGKFTSRLALSLALLGPIALMVATGAEAQDDNLSGTVIAVEDITYLGCETETSFFEGEVTESDMESVFSSKPVATTVEPCPPGSVIRTFTTTIAEADRLGLIYTPVTGDEQSDAASAETLRERLALPPLTSADSGEAATSSCRGRGITKRNLYYPGSSGGAVY